MDDLFGLMCNNITPEKKLLTAVSSGLQDTLEKLIQEGLADLDAKLLQHNGNTALHIACSKGYHGCVRRLLNAGANADTRNNFGFTPLSLALRENNIECIRAIFERGSFYTDLYLIWTSEQVDHIPTWVSYSPDTLMLLITATPSLDHYDKLDIPAKIYDYFLKKPSSTALMKVFFGTGHKLPPAAFASLTGGLTLFEREWMKKFNSVKKLQYYAALNVRRNMKVNILFGVKHLPIPHKLMDYLISCYEIE